MMLAVMVLIGIFADLQNQKIADQDLRSSVRDQIGLIRTKLEGNISSDVYLVRGLISTLQTEPDMKQARFAELAKNLFMEQSQLRNIAAAPGLVITMMYPMKGNEKAIGLDYRKNPKQKAAAMQVRNNGHAVIAGPVNLVQGGQGFIGRFPVFTTADGVRSFWGIVSAVIDVNRLYKDSGILDDDLPIEIALIGKDAKGEAGEQFYGQKSTLAASPEYLDVQLPNGSWRIVATPKGGWNVNSGDLWIQRLWIIAIGVILLFPVIISRRFAIHRRENFKELRKREGQLGRLSKRLDLALDASKVGVWEMDLATGTLLWDDRMNELYNLPADGKQRSYEDWKNSLHPDDRDRARRDFKTALENKSRYHSDFRVIWKSGVVRNIRAIGATYEDSDGSSRITGVNWDVTDDVAKTNDLRRAKLDMEARNAELIQAKSEIEHVAMHDSLTGIPNRRFLDNHLATMAVRRNSENISAALLVVDLDRFKQINDTFGHKAGDALLVHVSRILKSCARSRDIVARIGGDEFVIVCESDCDPDSLQVLASTIIDRMCSPFVVDGCEFRFGVCIGISSNNAVSGGIDQLLINADLALYRAKSQGRNCCEFFSEELRTKSIRDKKIADEIHRGLERNEFIPFYQPQFDANTHSIVGVEALARWNHPQLGILAPDKFMNIAEEINVSAAIDHQILKTSLNDFEVWTKLGLDIPKVSVNVSLQRLHDEKLLNSLRVLDIKPNTLSFELVESIFLDESDDVVISNLDQIKELGIDIEIDDFGTGHTSIVSLLKLKPSRLKIDRQLVIPAIDSDAPKQLVGSIIEIGKSLNIEVVAEGVETAEHARLLRVLGCDILQGFAFARPMPACEIQKFLSVELKLTA